MADWITLAVLCLSAAALSSVFLNTRNKKMGPFSGTRITAEPGNTVFLFDGTDLIGSSRSNEVNRRENILDWASLKAALTVTHPDFPQSPEPVESQGELLITPADSASGPGVFCEWVDGVIRVEVPKPSTKKPGPVYEPEWQKPMQSAMEHAPYPVWFLGHQNEVLWHNTAYSTLAKRALGKEHNVKEPLFEDLDEPDVPGRKNRISLNVAGSDKKLWYDLTTVPQDHGCLCYAVDINTVIDAEIAQRNFVQTLAKTFAHLSIGLAIFDRDRQLALFNPALVDLTTLPADFLSGRPSVSTFFDRLRNHNMMPEPKNYGGWRQQMNNLVKAAADGRYQETWSLPSGSVYSISGRPHPDGAVAFLFEDITAEITLTRQFRSELGLGQSILDKLENAIAVFSTDGSLALSNAAYNRLWDVDPENSFAQTTALDATRVWQDRCHATPLWGEIRDFIENRDNRAEWTAQVKLRAGGKLTCFISPIQNGATLVSFSETNDDLIPAGFSFADN